MGVVREVEFRRRKIAAVFEKAEKLARVPEGEELQAEYARHLCVLISGFVERAIGAIILQYAEGSTPGPIKAYLSASLGRVTSVDKERLLKIVGSLDATWREQIDAYVVDERMEALNSIVGLRNDVAHGGGGSVSLKRVRYYWVLVEEVVGKVEELVFKRPELKGGKRVR